MALIRCGNGASGDVVPKHTIIEYVGNVIAGLTKESTVANVQNAVTVTTASDGSTKTLNVDTCTATHRYGSGSTTRTIKSSVAGTLITGTTVEHLDADEVHTEAGASHATNIYWFIADEDA